VKVILSKDIKELGKRGQVVEVSEGYARNYLLPRSLAVLATQSAERTLVQEKQAQDRKKAREVATAQELAAKLMSTPLSLAVKAGDGGRLFGSVTSADIVHALAARGITIDKRRIELKEPIKAVGRYVVEAKLYPEVSARLTIEVIAE